MSIEFDRVRLLWPDHLGLARGKYLPKERAAGGTAHTINLFALGFDREIYEHPGAMTTEGLPDMDAEYEPEEVRLGWEQNTAVVIPHLTRLGQPVMMAPRNVLIAELDKWSTIGYRPMVGLELEAFLFEPDEDGWQPICTPGHYVCGTGMAVDPSGTVDEIMKVAHEVGLPLESVNSEFDNGQFEFTLTYADALRAADEAFLFKVMAKEVAAKRGLLLTFMGKPINERGGSGLHINLSLSDGAGINALYDQESDDGLSQLARDTIGGMLHHHVGMTALLAPTVNAYKRLQPGSLCGYWANWGYDHRGVSLRVPPSRGSGTRLEHRVADGSVTPHQAIAAVLAAARLGVENNYDLAPAEILDCIDNASTDIVVPSSLAEALDALVADDALVKAFGPEFVDGFVTVKRAEWERYRFYTTDWETTEYLPFL